MRIVNLVGEPPVGQAMGKIYAPQTKILEGRTNLSERAFEALFNVL
jgi:hypothetical protein